MRPLESSVDGVSVGAVLRPVQAFETLPDDELRRYTTRLQVQIIARLRLHSAAR